MLEPAILYKDKLNIAHNKTAFDDKFMYANYMNYFTFNQKIEDTTWNEIQYVSVDQQDEVIGYLSASVNRIDDIVTSLTVVNYYNPSYTFSRDFHSFLDQLFTKHNFRKICFSVLIDNPAEKMYDRFINKYGGRVVGIRKSHIKIPNGTICDMKLYEILKDDYLKRKRGN